MVIFSVQYHQKLALPALYAFDKSFELRRLFHKGAWSNVSAYKSCLVYRKMYANPTCVKIFSHRCVFLINTWQPHSQDTFPKIFEARKNGGTEYTFSARLANQMIVNSSAKHLLIIIIFQLPTAALDRYRNSVRGNS